jgi:hypothetical protein
MKLFMEAGFLRIARANGEAYYFNVNQLAMIYNNPADKTVIITGTGFEKKFRLEEAEQLLKVVEGMTAQAPPAAT